MKQLYIDFDGVILDTISYPYTVLAKQGIDATDTEKVSIFYQNLNWKEFIKKVPVINNGIECIQKLLESNQFEITILTHVTKLEEAIEKTNYIRKYFQGINIIPVPREISKTKMVHAKGTILVDDFVENLKEWEEAGGISIRFSTKKKGKGYPVIDHLDQLLNMNLTLP